MSISVLPRPEPDLSEHYLGMLTALVLRCGDGDENAMGDLFDLTYYLVEAAAHDDAVRTFGPDAATMDAFRRIWRYAPTFRPATAGVLAWMVAQAHAADSMAGPAALTA